MAQQALVTLSASQRELADVIKSTVYGGGDLTDSEMAIFLAECERIGVHPLSKGAHIWKDKSNRVGLAVSVHTLTALAERDQKAAMIDYEWEVDKDKGTIMSCTCVGEVWDERTSTWKTRKATIHREDVSWLFNKDNWKNQPRTMWENRARAKWCRVHRADVCGPLYSVEEVEDVPREPDRKTIDVRSVEVLDAKVIEAPKAAAEKSIDAKQEPTALHVDDIQAMRKARWSSLNKAFGVPTVELKPQVLAAVEQLHIAADAGYWNDAQAVAVESAVRAMRTAPTREPGED